VSGLVFVRGGIPRIMQGTTKVTTVERWGWLEGRSQQLYIENNSVTADLVVSFCQADADAGVGITIPATVGSAGNPFILPIEAVEIFTKAAAAVPFTVLVLLRRG